MIERKKNEIIFVTFILKILFFASSNSRKFQKQKKINKNEYNSSNMLHPFSFLTTLRDVLRLWIFFLHS